MNAQLALFFESRPEALDLYLALEEFLLALLPEATVRVQKTQISFDGQSGFGCVSLPRRKKDSGLVLSLGLGRPLEGTRVLTAVPIRPGRWTNHIRVTSAEELDDQLSVWLAEAWAFAHRK